MGELQDESRTQTDVLGSPPARPHNMFSRDLPAAAPEAYPVVKMDVPDGRRFSEMMRADNLAILAQADEAAKAVVDNDSLLHAVDIGSELRKRLKRLDERLDGWTKPLYRVWKDLKNMHTSMRAPFTQRIDLLEAVASRFKIEQERRRREEEEARIAEQKRRQEEDERRRREHELAAAHAEAAAYDAWWTGERDRRERERRDREARERREQEGRLNQAVAAENAGSPARADAILETATPIEPPLPATPPAPPPAKVAEVPYSPPPPPPLPAVSTPEVARTAKLVHVTRWRAEVVDKVAFLRGLIELKIPMDAIEVRQGWLDKQAEKLKDRLAYPGVEAKPFGDAYIKE